MFWRILTPASLAAATRTAVWLGNPDVAADSNARVAERVFTGEMMAKEAGDPERICFKVKESLVCRHYGDKRVADLQIGDVQCVKEGDQSSESLAGLSGLNAGDVATVRISTELVTKVTAHDAGLIKENSLKELVTLLRVKIEATTKFETLQKITAIYRGSTKNGKKHMFLNYGGVGASTQLACFNVHRSWGYSNLTDADDMLKMMQYGDSFCMCPDDQNTEVRTLTADLQVGANVVMTIMHERETFEDGSTEMKHTVKMVKGTALVSYRSALTEATGWVQEYKPHGQFCIKITDTKSHQAFVANVNQVNNGDSVCFEPDLQKIGDQTALLILGGGKNVDLTWGYDLVSYKGDAPTVIATTENMIETMNVHGYSKKKVSTDPKTVQKVSAVYEGARSLENSGDAKMFVNNEWTAAELECFKVTKTLGFARLATSHTEEMQPGTSFCVRVSDQNVAVQQTIDDLSVGNHVMMDLIYEMVVYEVDTNTGTKWTTTEPHYTVTIAPGTETQIDQRSVQEARVKFNAVEKSDSDGMKYCFEILESTSFVGVDGISSEIPKNNDVCFLASVQNANNLATLLLLSQGATMDVRWQHVWVSYDNIDSRGTTTSIDEYLITQIIFPTELLNVEFYRIPISVQKMSAIYKGSIKTDSAKMLVNARVGTCAELACFTLKQSKGYTNVSNTEHTELQTNDEFCLCIAEQNPGVQTILFNLEKGNVVAMNWVNELVEYSTKTSQKTPWKQTFETAHSFAVKLGAEIQSVPASNQHATLRFVSATSAMDELREYCFVVLTSESYVHESTTLGSTRLVSGDKLCLSLELQTVKNQVKLMALPMATTVKMRWNNVELFYQTGEGPTDATVEPIMTDMSRQN